MSRPVCVRLTKKAQPLSITFTEDEYVCLYSAAAVDGRTVSAYVRESAEQAAQGLAPERAARAAVLPLPVWVRLVVLNRIGVSALGEQLGVFG
jgi:hypothetical protein